jgi:hypothetical protein
MRKLVASLCVACVGVVALAAAPDTPKEDEKKKDAPPTEVTLGEKTETITPGKVADGWAEGGKIDVQAKENTLTVLMTGTAAAHCRVGCQSMAVQTYQLTQEFEITSSDPKVTQVVLSLESALNGFLWARHKASACMRLAQASVGPAGWANPMGVSHPPACVSAGGCSSYSQKAGPTESGPMPLGKYVLTACFTVDAGASGFLNGHGQADFSAEEALPDNWKQEGNPFKEAERKDYGFSITVSAAPPSNGAAPAPKATAVGIRPGVQKVRYTPQSRPAAITSPTTPPVPPLAPGR